MLPDGTLLRWFPTGELRHEPFGGEWSHYFPQASPLRSPEASRSAWEGVREEPPLPDEEDFWRDYGEPLPNFVEAGVRLSQAVEQIRTEAEKSAAEESARGTGARMLSDLAMPVVPILSPAGSTDRGPHWSSPSLLATLALMAMSDISGGARIISCKRCGAPAVTRSHRGLYCSERCRNR